MVIGIVIGFVLSPLSVNIAQKLGFSLYNREGLDS